LTTNPLITGNVVVGRVAVTATVVTATTVVAGTVATDFTAVGESTVGVGRVFAVFVVVATAIDVVAVGGFVFNATTVIVGATVVVDSTVVVNARVVEGVKICAFDVVGSSVVEGTPAVPVVVGAVGRGGSAGAGIVTSGAWATSTGPGIIARDVSGLSTVIGTGGAGM